LFVARCPSWFFVLIVNDPCVIQVLSGKVASVSIFTRRVLWTIPRVCANPHLLHGTMKMLVLSSRITLESHCLYCSILSSIMFGNSQPRVLWVIVAMVTMPHSAIALLRKIYISFPHPFDCVSFLICSYSNTHSLEILSLCPCDLCRPPHTCRSSQYELTELLQHLFFAHR
jgi:hypothetical protein